MLSDEFKSQTKGIVQKIKDELSSVRTNRPSAGMIENIKAECYGQSMLIKQLGSISILPPREIQIQAWDKEAAQSITQAIESSHTGFTANTEGNTIRVFLPELNKERREELTKHIKKMGEENRIQIRGARDEANKKVERQEKGGELNEDQKFRERNEIQKATEKANQEIEELIERKIKEISE